MFSFKQFGRALAHAPAVAHDPPSIKALPLPLSQPLPLAVPLHPCTPRSPDVCGPGVAAPHRNRRGPSGRRSQLRPLRGPGSVLNVHVALALALFVEVVV